jgi:hypothetical protein
MSMETLEARVVELERLMGVVLRQTTPSPMEEKDWRRTVGMFDNDPLMKEIVDVGRRLRAQERRKARR